MSGVLMTQSVLLTSWHLEMQRLITASRHLAAQRLLLASFHLAVSVRTELPAGVTLSLFMVVPACARSSHILNDLRGVFFCAAYYLPQKVCF